MGLAPCGFENHSIFAKQKMTEWINELDENGGNLFRLWMAPWAYELEWDDLRDHSNHQNRANELDRIFELAEQSEMYIELGLMPPAELGLNNPNGHGWLDNPYKNELNLNNGFLDFCTNDEAKKYFKNKLRYITPR